MKNIYLGLKFMFSYFSILPVHFDKKDDLLKASVLGAMLFFLPFGGLILGGISVTLYTILEALGWYAGLIAAVCYMMLYGFIHTEAIMDVADALYAKHSGKDAYTVIKEPTVGAMGVLWAVSMMLVKVAGIVFLFKVDGWDYFLAILLVSRLGLLLLFYTQTFRSSFITQLQEAFKPKYFITSYILFSMIGFIIVGWHFFILFGFGLMVSYLLAKRLKKALGFINGDALGTTLESVEILLFIGVALLWL